MNSFEIIALLVTGVGVVSFAVIFTILYLSYAHSSVAELEAGKMDVELIEETIYNNINNEKTMRRIWHRTKQIAFYVAIAILIPFLVLSLISKLTTGVAMIGGKGMIVVASGSMSEKNPANSYLAFLDNQVDTYDLIFVERVSDPSELGVYDVIAFTNDEGTNIIHRIVGIENTATGTRYVTRGDSNNADDSYKPTFEDVIGKYTDERVPLVGVFVMFLQSYSGIITLAAVIYCLIMIELVSDKIFKGQNARLEILKSSIDFEAERQFDDEMHSKFVETVRFKDYLYTFDETGFVKKQHISDLESDSDSFDENNLIANTAEDTPREKSELDRD